MARRVAVMVSRQDVTDQKGVDPHIVLLGRAFQGRRLGHQHNAVRGRTARRRSRGPQLAAYGSDNDERSAAGLTQGLDAILEREPVANIAGFDDPSKIGQACFTDRAATVGNSYVDDDINGLRARG